MTKRLSYVNENYSSTIESTTLVKVIPGMSQDVLSNVLNYVPKHEKLDMSMKVQKLCINKIIIDQNVFIMCNLCLNIKM